MTNQEILKIAVQQSAYDCNCEPEDFFRETNVIVHSQKNEKARKYLELPLACNLVYYGNQIVASTTAELEESVRQYLEKYPAEHCFETPNLHVLNDKLQEMGLRICFMAEYFLPDMKFFSKAENANDKTQHRENEFGLVQENDLANRYEIKVLQQSDFTGLYTTEWSNALCEKRKELDVLGVGAYDNGKLIGLAGCSADCDSMYQIGIDVLPEYRKQGIASALTKRLAFETLKLGKVPFYCAAWSNVKSVRNAIKSGFRPAWVELTAKSADFVAEMNQ